MISILIFSEWKDVYLEMARKANVTAQVLNHYKAASNYVYGEAMPNFVHPLIKVLDIKDTDVFYDIGSGTFD